MKKRVQEMEAEAERLKDFHKENSQVGESTGEGGSGGGEGGEDSAEIVDARSVYLGNVRLFTLLIRRRASLKRSAAGRLWEHGRGDSGAFRVVRTGQPHHHPLRQVYRPAEGVRCRLSERGRELTSVR